MTTFLLIRHAATDFVNKTMCGRMPGVHLNREGKRQALELAERLAGLNIVAIYSSPLERALQTAEPLARKLSLEARARDSLDEIEFGDWTGRSLQELEAQPAWRRFNTFRSCTRIPGGEMMQEAQTRIVNAIDEFRAAHPDEVVAVVSHADMIKSAIAHYLGVHLDMFHRIEISPASVSVIGVHDWGVQVLRVNDTGGVIDRGDVHP